MPRACSICTHDKRDAIDAALMAGESYRSITGRFGVSAGAIARHKSGHTPAHLAMAHEAEAVASADVLLHQLEQLRRDARRIGQKAEKATEFSAALSAVREQSRIIETLLKVAGELVDAPAVHIIVNPQWIEIRQAVVASLAPYPDARQAVVEALGMVEALGGGDGHRR